MIPATLLRNVGFLLSSDFVYWALFSWVASFSSLSWRVNWLFPVIEKRQAKRSRWSTSEVKYAINFVSSRMFIRTSAGSIQFGEEDMAGPRSSLDLLHRIGIYLRVLLPGSLAALYKKWVALDIAGRTYAPSSLFSYIMWNAISYPFLIRVRNK